jgi:hypothetical protein
MYNYIENVKVPQLLQNCWIKMTGIIWSTIHHAQSSYQIWKYRTNDLRGVNNKHQNWTHFCVAWKSCKVVPYIFFILCTGFELTTLMVIGTPTTIWSWSQHSLHLIYHTFCTSIIIWSQTFCHIIFWFFKQGNQNM